LLNFFLFYFIFALLIVICLLNVCLGLSIINSNYLNLILLHKFCLYYFYAIMFNFLLELRRIYDSWNVSKIAVVHEPQQFCVLNHNLRLTVVFLFHSFICIPLFSKHQVYFSKLEKGKVNFVLYLRKLKKKTKWNKFPMHPFP